MVRIVEAGPRLVVDLPWCHAHREECRQQLGFDPSILRFELWRGDELFAKGPLDESLRLEVSLRGQPPGVWTLRLLASSKLFWEQYVFAQPELTRSPEEIDRLARRWAPVFLFSPKEEYFPVSLHTLLCSPALLQSEQTIEVDTVFGEIEVPFPELDEFLRYNGNASYLLDQSAFEPDSILEGIRGDFRSSVVYYSWLEDPATGRGFLNYHTFYAFDPKTGIARMLGIGPHVFDRESLTIVLRRDGSPEALVLSGHLEDQKILFFDSLKIWSTGRVRMGWPDERCAAVEGHPVVPVAEGSHALYPTAGLYHVSVLTEVAGHILNSLLPRKKADGDELSDHQVLLPPSFESDRFARYELRPLRLDLLRSEPLPPSELYDPSTAALVFSGFWVDVPGFQNERFPPFSKREMFPAEWVDGAFAWDWEDLPARIVEHNRALAARIAELARGG